MADDDDTSDGSFSDDSLFWSDSSFRYSSDSSTDDSISTVKSDTNVVGTRKQKRNTSFVVVSLPLLKLLQTEASSLRWAVRKREKLIPRALDFSSRVQKDFADGAQVQQRWIERFGVFVGAMVILK